MKGGLASPLLVNILLNVVASIVRYDQEVKCIQIGKEEEKLTLFTNVMIIYVGNPMVQKKFLQLIRA